MASCNVSKMQPLLQSNVKNIYRWCCTLRVWIGGAGSRKSVRQCHMQQRTVQLFSCYFSFSLFSHF